MLEIEGKYTSAKIFAKTIDEGTEEQTLAICNHPVFKDCKIRIMPDCHKGKGCTIGFTSEMPKNGEIIPNIIGVDQSCGVLAVKLDEKDILNDYEKLDKVVRRQIPAGRNGRKLVSKDIPSELVEEVKRISKDILKENYMNDLLKIGSLGDGNHFISVEKGNTGTYLIVHSGSRNIGNRLAIYFQQLAIEKNCYGEGELKQLSFLTGKDAQDYLDCAKFCNTYSYWNRYVIAKEIMVGMRWRETEKIESIHNYIANDGIIRKGAISSKENEKVIIPLNMADGSLIATGKGNDDWNNSAPHGAGRVYSRTTAKEKLSMQEYKERMKNIYSTCVSTGTLDEAPMAYKNADEIIEGIEPTAQILDHLIPLYNFKVS